MTNDSAQSSHDLSACPHCGRLLAPGATFERSWHIGLGVGPELPVTCCMTERYLQLQREREAEQAQAAAAPAQSSGPINIAPGPRRGPPPAPVAPPRTIPL